MSARAQVFLGGACGSTTWRRDVAIPRLEAAGVGYFDPQLAPGAWTPAHEAVDVAAKAAADVLLFVVHEATRSVAGIAEVAYLVAAGRPLALYVGDVPEAARIDGRSLDAAERDDLNRGRLFLRTMAEQHEVPVHASIAAATDHAIALARAARPALSLEEVRAVLAEVSYRDFEIGVEERAGGYEIRLRRVEPDADTGVPAVQLGRRWPIERTSTRGEIVQTALLAALTWEEHAVREDFRYRGARVFGPHLDVDRLATLAGLDGGDPQTPGPAGPATQAMTAVPARPRPGSAGAAGRGPAGRGSRGEGALRRRARRGSRAARRVLPRGRTDPRHGARGGAPGRGRLLRPAGRGEGRPLHPPIAVLPRLLRDEGRARLPRAAPPRPRGAIAARDARGARRSPRSQPLARCARRTLSRRDGGALALAAGALGRRLLDALALALGVPEGAFADAPGEAPYLLTKLIAYHPQPRGLPAREGVAAHCDFSWLTLLLQDEAGGLETRPRSGAWLAVPPVPGALFVNLGELAEVASGGRFRAAPHRVRNPSTARRRISVPVFVSPALTTRVAPLVPPAARRGPGEHTIEHARDHAHRVLGPGEAGAPGSAFVFGNREWRRKGLGRWCHDERCLREP